MKKILLGFLLISSFCFGQNVTVTLSKADIVDINRAIKQDMVQDSVISSDKVIAAKSCEDALKRANRNQTVTVPLKYVRTSLQRLAYSYQEVDRNMPSYRKFLRIVKQLAINDPNLTFLTSDNDFIRIYMNEASINQIKERIKGNVE